MIIAPVAPVSPFHHRHRKRKQEVVMKSATVRMAEEPEAPEESKKVTFFVAAMTWFKNLINK